MTSSPFERQITEPETSDRTTTSPTRMTDGPQQFAATSSFLEHDRPSIRLVELPAWLQAFAASVGEPSELEAPASDAVAMSAEEPGSPAPEPKASRVMDKAPGSFGTNFISEDDLPEWLRSIAPGEGDEAEAELFLLGGAENGEHLAVPNVTRAWSTSKDARGVDESTSLFALVASQAPQSVLPVAGSATTGARAQIGERRAAIAQAETTGMVASYGSDVPPELAGTDLQMPATQASASSEAAPVRVKLPMLPIAVAGVLMLVLIVVAIALFVL